MLLNDCDFISIDTLFDCENAGEEVTEVSHNVRINANFRPVRTAPGLLDRFSIMNLGIGLVMS